MPQDNSFDNSIAYSLQNVARTLSVGPDDNLCMGHRHSVKCNSLHRHCKVEEELHSVNL